MQIHNAVGNPGGGAVRIVGGFLDRVGHDDAT